jgi:hypothetical protein
LPYFDSLTVVYAGSNLKVLLVSLDFKRQFNERLIPFVEKNNIRSGVVLLDEPDYNSWIDKVDPEWNGSIPATVIMKPAAGFKKFYEREFSYSEINKIVQPLIIHKK